MRNDHCHYCFRISDDMRDVDLRPDGMTWKAAWPSRICGKCRKRLNVSRQFRYRKNKIEKAVDNSQIVR